MALSLTFAFNRLLKAGEKITNSLVNTVLTSVTASLSGAVANANLESSAVKNNVTVPDDFWYAAGTLAAGVYSATYNAALTAWKTGLLLCFKADAANAGACSLNFGAGAKLIKSANGADLQANDIQAGQIVCVRYDGTDCRMMSQRGRPATIDAGAVSGTANALTLTLTPGTLTLAQLEGVVILARAAAVNTGAATLTVNALAATAIKTQRNTALTGGEIAGANALLPMMYVASLSAFVLLSAEASADAGIVGQAKDLTVTWNAANQVRVRASEATLKNGAKSYVAQSVDKTVDITAAGLLGLDTGAEAINTWYYVWLIYDPTNNLLSAVFSTQTSAALVATTLTTYTYKALVGVVRNDAASDFIPFFQQGREIGLADYGGVGSTVFSGASPTVETGINLSGLVPPIGKAVRGVVGTITASNHVRAVVAGHWDGTYLYHSVPLNIGTTAATDAYGFYASGPFEVPLAYPAGVGGVPFLYWKTAAAVSYKILVTGWTI